MKLTWLLPAVLSGLLIFSTSLNTSDKVQATAEHALPMADAEPMPADSGLFLPASVKSTPIGTLLSINEGGGIESMQRGGTIPEGWKPDLPMNLSGPMPADAEIRAAIVKAVEYVLELQNENGSWDVVLEGNLLSQTADEAVDAIATTSLCGYALRRHVKVDPARINAALVKASKYVMDRVYRGKLPLAVQYANWRYTLGLKFLHQEFMLSTDEAFKDEIRSVSRRLIQGLLRLQLSNNPAPLLERKRRTRISSRYRNTAMPSSLGVVLAPPTDADYRGGALVEKVLPGSAAEKTGIKAGDRIYETEGMRVENALDYYMQETEFVGGQKINIGVRREGAKDFKKDVSLEQVWPGYLGLQINPGVGEGPVVEGFLAFSPCRGKLEIGDIISEAGDAEIKNIDEFREVERGLKPGDKVRMKVLRGEKRKKVSESIEASGAPEGWFYFGIRAEDKGDEDGVVIENDPRAGTPAAEAGLASEDRVTWIGDTPILGIDHLIDFAGTIAGGRSYRVKWMRGGTEMEADIIARPIPQPFDMGIMVDINREFKAMIRQMTKGGAAEKAGFKNGDVFNSINGIPTPDIFDWQDAFFTLSAGEEAVFVMQRGGKEETIKLELPRIVETGSEEDTIEEGGWAYYPSMGESPSFSTAAAMLVLMDVERDLGIKGLGKVLKSPLKSAANLVNGLRVADAKNGGQDSYVYFAQSKTMGQPATDIKGSQGRNAICELALVRMGLFRRNKGTLKKIIDQWTKYRGELDAVRNMVFYNPPNKGGSPHNFDRNWNAAYYWMYGHYHTLLAARECGGKTFTDINTIAVKAVMLDRESDGLWLDHPSFGKLCGTSLALWILGESEGPWRDGYGDPTTQGKKDGGLEPDTPEE